MARAATAPARHAPARRPARAPSRRPAAATHGARPLPRGAAVLDAILHGRAWIGLLFVLLAGIVFFNVDLLRMNREIARTEERIGTLKQENARLRTDVARLGSSERIQRVAAERGLVLPAPAEVRYLRSNPAVDARRAASRIAATQQPGTPQRE
jgi:cell division protein FtsL